MQAIDINCDMGESTSLWPYRIDNDIALLPYLSSVNIACGAHAGDEETMRRLVDLAMKNNIAIGAHPSYQDRLNFGRMDVMDIELRPEELPEILVYQINKLQKICHEFGTKIHHVKPHGALYNRAAWDGTVSSFICTSLNEVDSSLILYGLSGSKMKTEAAAYNIRFVNEVFADRTYQEDGSLTPRSASNAMIEDEEQSLQQVLQMIQQGTVQATGGKSVKITAETICIHGDGLHALAFARRIHQTLNQKNIEIKSV
jgi:5-oxoprolinase (ATP-hydrolysing) subunit A